MAFTSRPIHNPPFFIVKNEGLFGLFSWFLPFYGFVQAAFQAKYHNMVISVKILKPSPEMHYRP
jgi:hypothetical protein